MSVDTKDIIAALALLAEAFPNCFTREQHHPHRPLKIGIDHDLAERCSALNVKERSVAMKYYTSRLLYLESLVEGADRIDLDGSSAGKVSADDAEHARIRITGILAGRDAELAAAKAARKARKAARKAVVQPPPTTPPTPKPSPATSPKPANGTLGLRDRPLLTLPAFRKEAARR